jgi:5-methylcytosine-specific restriction protein A
MTKLRTLAPLVRTLDTSTTRLPLKQADPHYLTAEHRAWRAQVLARAGGRCEAVDDHGHRCSKAQPEHRMFADHIVELREGGSLLDINNGQCLCFVHHERKSAAMRARRLGGVVENPEPRQGITPAVPMGRFFTAKKRI